MNGLVPASTDAVVPAPTTANAGVRALPPLAVHVPDSALDDLRRRLAATRWPQDTGNEDWYYGVNSDYLKGLAEYWALGFDWREAEAAINAHAQYRVEIDDVPVHFLHAPGKGPAPMPLILIHGWPWTFWDWRDVIGPLTDPESHGGDPADAFDLVIPSLPGFGFSTPLARPDMNFWKMADIFQRLMTEVLGNARYAAGGSDMGAMIAGQLGHKYAASLHGIYLARGMRLDFLSGERPWDVTGGRMVPENVPGPLREEIIAIQRRFASHIAVHVLDSATLSHGLADSPVGMLAWILQRWRTWSDCGGDVETVFSRDHMLANATIWWATNAIGSSLRTYANAVRYPWTPVHDRVPAIEAPAGITFLGFENPPGISARDCVGAWRKSREAAWFNPIHLAAHERGGHFASIENPAAVVADLRATFRPLR